MAAHRLFMRDRLSAPAEADDRRHGRNPLGRTGATIGSRMIAAAHAAAAMHMAEAAKRHQSRDQREEAGT